MRNTYDSIGTSQRWYKYLPSLDSNHIISVNTSEKQKTYNISLLQNNDPFKYLVITFTPDRNQSHQFKSIHIKAQQESKICSTSPLKNCHSQLYLFYILIQIVIIYYYILHYPTTNMN